MSDTVTKLLQLMHRSFDIDPQTINPDGRAATFAAAAALAVSFAAAAADDAPPYKLTAGAYHLASGGGNAWDLNLRRSLGQGNVWLGLFDAPRQDQRQFRLGWDSNLDLGDWRVMPSLQIASYGYAAGSLNVETGSTWFVGAGIGRTNLRPNQNLNFDPNDAYSLAAGRRAENGDSVQMQWVRDNRLNPDQRHLHFVYRAGVGSGDRLGVDLLFKQGRVDDTTIHRWGATVTYDWPRYFIRFAYDPKVNFTPDDMLRLSTGLRF